MIKAETMSPKQLRDYGLLMGTVIVVLFSVYPWFILKKGFMAWPWALSAFFWLAAVIYPKALLPIYRAWMKVGLVLGKINSTIILTLCYFVLFFPVALIFRLMKRDRLYRFSSKQDSSYRQVREIPRSVQQMEKPF